MRARARDLNLAGRGKGAYKLQLEERTGSTGAEVSFDNVTLRGVKTLFTSFVLGRFKGARRYVTLARIHSRQLERALT